MLAFVVLLLAALSRFFPFMMPHANTAMHNVGLNITAVGAGLLFFGSRRPRWEAIVAAAVMAVTDFLLTKYIYAYPFHVSGYLVTWAWYAAACLMGSALLHKITALRVVAGVFASATSFFLLSNFMVWAGSHFYAHSFGGLVRCYAMGLPFYRNDLVSTGLAAGLLFGLPVLAAAFFGSLRMQQRQAQA